MSTNPVSAMKLYSELFCIMIYQSRFSASDAENLGRHRYVQCHVQIGTNVYLLNRNTTQTTIRHSYKTTQATAHNNKQNRQKHPHTTNQQQHPRYYTYQIIHLLILTELECYQEDYLLTLTFTDLKSTDPKAKYIEDASYCNRNIKVYSWA